MNKIASTRRQAARRVGLLGPLVLMGSSGVVAGDVADRTGEAAAVPSRAGPVSEAQAWFPTTFQQAERLSRGQWSPASGNLVAATGLYRVNTTGDTVDAAPGDGACADAGGNCSLRAAVMEANAHAGFDRILLRAATYSLTIAGADENGAATGDIDITSPDGVNITGRPLAADTILDGADLDRFFHVLPGATASLSNLTLTNGTSSLGGALLNEGGSLYGFNLHVTGNNSTNIAGGLAAKDGAHTQIDSSTFSGNASTTTSGGVDNVNSVMLLTNVTVSGNAAGSGYNSGGIGNSTDSSTYLYVVHGTIVNNAAGLRGGGIRVLDGAVYLQDTILGNNSAPDLGPQCYTSSATAYVVSLGYTHIQNATDCQFYGADTDFTVAPQVSPLAENGGKTPTHALPLNSTHREAIPAESCGARYDQRGVRRPQDGNNNGLFTCDVGAYEHVGPFTPLQPVPSEALDHPTATFVWSANVSATQYRVDVRGVGFEFELTHAGTRAELCIGSVCSARINLSAVPNQSELEWRVRAIYPGGRATTVWQPFALAVPGVPVLTTPADFASLLPANFGGLQWTATPAAGKLTLRVYDAFTDAQVFVKVYSATTTPALDDICGSTTCTVDSASLGLQADIGRAYAWRVSAQLTVDGKTYSTRSKTSHFSFVMPTARAGAATAEPAGR